MTPARSVPSLRSALLLCGALLATTAAVAGGSHAGGHHDSPIGQPGVAPPHNAARIEIKIYMGIDGARDHALDHLATETGPRGRRHGRASSLDP